MEEVRHLFSTPPHNHLSANTRKMSFPASNPMWREMNPFTPDHSSAFMMRSTAHAMKSEWAKIAAEEVEANILMEEGLAKAYRRAAQIMETGTEDEKEHIEVYAPISHYTNMIKSQKPRASWVEIENQVCAAFFKFLDAQKDPAMLAKAIEEMPVLSKYRHQYTPEIQAARAAYWLSLIP